MILLHAIEAQVTVCKTRSKAPLVFDSREAAEHVAFITGYRLCPRCYA